jgi:hypothetical protein
MQQTVAGMERFLTVQPVWMGLFKELGGLIPKTLELEALEIDGGGVPGPVRRVQLKGRVVGAGEGGVADFVDALEESPLFTGVELTSSELRAEPGKTRFEIEAMLE